MKKVILNERFQIDFSTGEVTDGATGATTRLEHRLQKLLELLVEKQGEVVARNLITAQVWDDYGNADESLNQGISFLRKVLDDAGKTTIITVPKKGYMLKGMLAEALPQQETAPAAPAKSKKRLVLYLVAALALSAVLYVVVVKKASTPDVIPNEAAPPADTQPGSGSPDVVR